MKKLLSIFFVTLFLTLSTPLLGQEAMIGEVKLFAGNFAPRGWAFCDGQLLSVSQNTALFSILGTTYGGDGRTTFALPKLHGEASGEKNSNIPRNDKKNKLPTVKHIICLQGIYPSRN